MKSVNPLDPLHTAIVEILVQNPYVRMKDLQRILEEKYSMSYTQQNLYRVVGVYIDQGMLTKSKGKIALDLYWVTQIQQFAEQGMFQIAKSTQGSINLDIKNGESIELVAESMHALTPIWDSVTLSLITKTKVESIHHYISHLYWTACGKYVPHDAQEFTRTLNATVYKVVGSDSFLDNHYAYFLRKKGRDVAVDPDANISSSGCALEIIDDYILEFILPQKLHTSFEHLYETIQSEKEISDELFRDVYTLKCDCSVVLTKDVQRAAELRRKLDQYF